MERSRAWRAERGCGVTNPNRDARGRYATWWYGLASFAALLLLMFFVVSTVLGYGNGP